MAYGPGQAYSPSPAWLAATADRERTVGTLRAGFAEGRLSQDELGERITRAYAARTYADLWALTADLPSGPYPYPLSGYGPVVATEGAVAAHEEASSWQSAAALLITALVIFTLAALVTAIVTAHVQPGYVSQVSIAPGAPPQPAKIMPFQRPVAPGAIAPVAAPHHPAG